MLENGNRLRRIGGGGCGGRLQGRRRLLSVCSSSSRHAAPMINPTDDVLAPTARTPNTIGQSHLRTGRIASGRISWEIIFAKKRSISNALRRLHVLLAFFSLITLYFVLLSSVGLWCYFVLFTACITFVNFASVKGFFSIKNLTTTTTTSHLVILIIISFPSSTYF